jgi:purine-binding chemotaxis protein CheW
MVSNIAVADEAAGPAPVTTQWVVFLCRDGRFGIPLAAVREIVTPRPFTRLPGAGPEICGLIGLRGRVVTVVDLGFVLRGHAAATLREHRLLLLDIDGRRVGAAVDEVVTIAPAPLMAPGDTDGRMAAGAVLGTGRIEDGTFVALDPAVLLAPLLN